MVEVGDLVVINGCVDLRVELKSLGCGLHEEGQEGQLSVVLGDEGILRACTQSHDLGDVNFDHGRQLSRVLQGLHHATSDRLTQTRHLLGRAT